MSREMTPEELAELTERLRAGDASALKEATTACKPKRVPKAPKREPTALERLKKHADDAAAHAARVRSIRLELEEIRKIPVGDHDARMAATTRQVKLQADLHVALFKIADTAEYLYTHLRAELDKLTDPELMPRT